MLKDSSFCQVAGFWPVHPRPRDAGAERPHAAEGPRFRRRSPNVGETEQIRLFGGKRGTAFLAGGAERSGVYDRAFRDEFG
jgi:hypothetical protein